MATIELAQLAVPAHLTGPGSFPGQSTNSQLLRRRRLPDPENGNAQANRSALESLDKLRRLRDIASVIVALNVSTMKALQDGFCDSPQIIDRCYDRYALLLSEEESSMVDSVVDSGGAHFENDILEYVNSMNLEQVKACLFEPRPSRFYSQLVDIRMKKYRASKVHAMLAARVDHGPIPEKFNYCTSYQSYVEHAVADEYEQLSLLKYTVDAARRLLSMINTAVEGGHLQHHELGILKSKAAALQVHFPEATAALGECRNNLFYPSAETWW